MARVGYWGDPGTTERDNAISNIIYSWDGGALTGLSVAAEQQRGYYDAGATVAASLLQIDCAAGNAQVGVVINSYWFTHASPIRGGGPQLNFGEKLDFPAPIQNYSSGNDLVIQGMIKHPYHYGHEPDGIGQLAFAYYMQPLQCPRQAPGSSRCPAATLENHIPAFAHVLGVLDTRPAASTRSYFEFAAHDSFTAFFGSPIADLDPAGRSLRYATKSPYSESTKLGDFTWPDYRFYRVHISYSQMKTMIAEAKSMVPDLWDASSSPDDWGIIMVTVLVELSNAAALQCQTGQGASGCNDIVMAASITGVDAYLGVALGDYEDVNRAAKNADRQGPRVIDPASDAVINCFVGRQCLGN